MKHKFFALLMLATLIFALMVPVHAAITEQATTTAAEELVDSAENKIKSTKAWSTAGLIGLAAIGGTIAMAWAIIKATTNIAKQPEASGQIRTAMMLGLVFIETVVIYALIVAILIVFVL